MDSKMNGSLSMRADGTVGCYSGPEAVAKRPDLKNSDGIAAAYINAGEWIARAALVGGKGGAS